MLLVVAKAGPYADAPSSTSRAYADKYAYSVLALLQRFYEPTAGEITVGGIDIRSIDMDIVRGMMGYVSQEAVLFPGTIRFNLTVSL